MPKIVGYARISTQDQNPALQIDALRASGAEVIFEDRASGAKADRQGLKKALAAVEPGDTLLVWKVDRLGRSLRQLIETLDGLHERGVYLRSVSDPIDTTTAVGRMAFQIVGTFAEFERTMIQERVRAGIAASRRAGNPHGRQSTMTPERTDHARQLIEGGQSWAEVARIMGVSKTSIVRAFKRHPAKERS
ncbi:recombinase family protein [Aureimonas psammosilenae]|uniref:recombinase family protein n=1 Tax=Aureimonas psammosilenae TaxID=2495496 RepID=UPI001260B37C|nr:recombinase family protein [Aureimonas psammosilenae]